MAKQKSQKEIERVETIEYFQTLVSEPVNWSMVSAQLKRIMTDNPQYTYKGIQYCLWYIQTQTNADIHSIAIVNYYYDDAKRYYQWRKQIKEQIKNWKPNDNTITIVKTEQQENIFD